jgi:DNA-binding SARP family transcriptional activator
VRIGVLGPMLVVDDVRGEVAVPAARLRALLAALVVRANRVVAVDELADIMWDGAEPAGAAKTIRVYVVRLRQALGPEIADRVLTRDPGYVCRLADHESDVLQLESLCAQGGNALRFGRWRQASDLLAEAAALWRGPVLQDVGSQTLRDECEPRLQHLRLQASEWRVEADLHLGRAAEVVPELLGLTSEHPLHERFHAHLMLALYRCGRPAEALSAFQRARRTLVEELGTEPGPELRRLYARILAEDGLLTAPAYATSPADRPRLNRSGPY